MPNKSLKTAEHDDQADKLAPLGYRFLIESSHERESSLARIDLRNAFLDQSSSLRNKANADYTLPAAVSVPLPDEQIWFEDSLLANLLARKSTRTFSGKSIDLAHLGFLLKMSCGIKPFRTTPPSFAEKLRAPRFYPSGGALYPLRVYVDAAKVEGLSEGLYRYNPLGHSLDLVNENPLDRETLYNSNIKITASGGPAAILLISAKPQLPVVKYREHAWRVLLMETGHLTQNLLLIATGLGLTSYPQSSISLRESEKSLRSSLKSEVLLQTVVIGQ